MKRYIKSAMWYGKTSNGYDVADGWTEEDIKLHKSIDWRSRNWEDYPVPEDSFISKAVCYMDDGRYENRVKFVKYLRSNPIFPPYYRPETNPFPELKGVVGPMYDGNKHDGYGVHDRYESQDMYDMLSR